MKINFLQAKKGIGALCKSYGFEEGDRSYPRAATFKSHTFTIDSPDMKGLTDYHSLLVEQAQLGHCLYTGQFTKPLNWESRKDRTDKDAKTQLLVIDVDGMSSEGFLAGSMSKSDVERAANEVISILPPEFQSVSCIAAASSSFGQKDKSISLHLHFLLSSPVAHNLLKSWLTAANYIVEKIYQKLDLTESLLCVKHLIDPALGQPSRIVYVAPPIFGRLKKNPFDNDKDRILLIEKQVPCLDMHLVTRNLAQNSALITKRKSEKLKELQKFYGISTKAPKTSRIVIKGKTCWVDIDPPKGPMEFAYEDADYIRYNMGGSTSCAYWVWKDNPEIVFNFHTDEPSFLFSVKDPETYNWHIEKFGRQYEKMKTKSGREIITQRFMLHDENSDTYQTLHYNKTDDKIIQLDQRRSIHEAINSTRDHGQPVPDPVPTCRISFDPTEERVFYREAGELKINSFEPSEYIRQTTKSVWGEDVGYGCGFLAAIESPVICEILIHLLGDDVECFEHFINWFAHIVQTRTPANTAWLVHGTQATGKGVFHKLVAQKIFGKYAQQRLLQELTDDKFNEWLATTVYLMIDEFNMHATNSSVIKVANQLKRLITEPTIPQRAMFKGQVEMPNWTNMIFATNDINGFAISDKRRVNIAPRQPAEISKERLPFISQHEVATNELIAKELEQFTAFLMDFKIDLNKVRNILKNEAREITLEAGMNSVEQFFTNIIKGNFEAFAQYLDKSESGLNEKEFAHLKQVKGIIRPMLDYVNTGKPCAMLKSDLLCIYSFMATKNISENFFGRMVGQHDLTIVKRNKPCGVQTPLSMRHRCIQTTWFFENSDELAMLKANNRVFANVTPITTPDTANNEVVVKPSTSASW